MSWPDPQDQLRWLPADPLRLVGAVGVPLAWAYAGPASAAAMFLVLGGQMLLRVLAPRPLDASMQLVVLAAGWAAVVGSYENVSWLDIPAHVLVTAVATWLAWAVMRWTGVAPPAGPGARGVVADVITVTSVGVLLSVLWEFGEWAGYTYLSDGIGVGYEDTIGDLACGGVGALVTAVLLARSRLRPRDGASPRPLARSR